MIPMLASALVLAAALPTPLAGAPAKPASASGLISTSQMAVRAVVEDRCRVSPDGATCLGLTSMRPMAVTRAHVTSRIDIVF
jgi:hypothetical protein